MNKEINRLIQAQDLRPGDLLRAGVSTNYFRLTTVTRVESGGTAMIAVTNESQADGTGPSLKHPTELVTVAIRYCVTCGTDLTDTMAVTVFEVTRDGRHVPTGRLMCVECGANGANVRPA